MPRCLLISGDPNTWKTSSLRTWTKAARPGVVHIITVPREEGWGSIPDDPLIKSHVLSVPYSFAGAPVGWKEIAMGVEQRVAEILAGKHGPVSTIAIDGLQKYGESVLGWITSGRCFTDEGFNGMVCYSRAKNLVKEFVLKMKAAPVNYVVFTTWAGYEKDNELEDDRMEGSKIVKAPRGIWPALMGTLSKEIVGMLPTVYATVQGSTGRWQVMKAGDVDGCGLKLPAEHMHKYFPTPFVPQSWPELEKKMYPQGYPTTQEGAKS